MFEFNTRGLVLLIHRHRDVQAADSGVQRALLNALMSNPDAQAALQRGLAHQGLSINMQSLQAHRDNLLPASAAAVAGMRRLPLQVVHMTQHLLCHAHCCLAQRTFLCP